MSLFSCRLPLWLAAGLIATSCVYAADKCKDAKVKCEGSEFQLFIENDMLAHTDRYYTNGIKIGIGVPGDTLEELLRGFSTLAILPFPKKEELHFGWFIGQNLYTPKKISVPAPQPFDRPWAAWLYLGGVIQRADPNSLDTVEVDVGFVGPPALGDQVQTTWHRLIGASKPQGWGNQIPAQAAFVASYVHKDKFKFGANYFELIPHVGGTVGNVFTLARAGGIVRAGINMTGFGPDSIEPGGALLQSTRSSQDPDLRNKFEIYGFAGIDARLVARNIFLDGPLFIDSPGVDRRHFVHDFSVGASIRYQFFRVSLTHILRSEEFYTTRGSGGKQTFDSVNIGIEF